MKRLITLCLIIMFTSALPSCGSSALLSDVNVSTDVLRPTNGGETATISYAIGRMARVSVYLQGADGTRYMLRENEARRESTDVYTLRFDGTAPTSDPVLLRRLLPTGHYTVVVAAAGDDGTNASVERPLTIEGSDVPLPEIVDLVISPLSITPNADAIDDVAEITYHLPVTATVDITVTSPDGKDIYALVANEEQEPILHRTFWNGRTPDGRVLPDGPYTYTIRAQDRYGSTVRRQATINVVAAGQPEATITYSYMAPQSIMLSEVFTVTMRVKNTGTVPIRTYGPASGYEYSTQQVFSSVENERYAAKSGGFWRIGVDWDSNSGAGKRYPFRWAISPRPPEQWKVPFVEDLLMPGEEALVVGRIKIEQQETKMGFFTGLIQDGVGFFQDKTGRTIIKVGF